jgi:hypothetical protein
MDIRALRNLGVIAVITTFAATLTLSTFPETAYAQTHGMTRRGDRRDTRQESRSTKHACNAAGGSSRSECRQTKRDVKQEGRHTR